MSADRRTQQLRAWTAWNETKLDHYGTELAASAVAHMRALEEDLGEFADADCATIDEARREYIAEAS